MHIGCCQRCWERCPGIEGKFRVSSGGGGSSWVWNKENNSDFERQNTIRKTSSAKAVDENDVTLAKMMEFESLLETSGERNLRSIILTHGECPCHCLAQTVWHREQSNICLKWDIEEIRSIGFPTINKKSPSLWWARCWRCYGLRKTWRNTCIRGDQRWSRCKPTTIAGGLSSLRLRAKYSLYLWRWGMCGVAYGSFYGFERHWRVGWIRWRRITRRSVKRNIVSYWPRLGRRPSRDLCSPIAMPQRDNHGLKRVGKVSRKSTKAGEAILDEDLA